jgi:hypothetical protein
MTRLWLFALVLAVMVSGVCAQDVRRPNADDNAHFGWADVLRADPVQGVTRTEVPRQECYEQPVVRHEGGNSAVGTVQWPVAQWATGYLIMAATTKTTRPSAVRSARSASSAGSSAMTWNTAIAARSTPRASTTIRASACACACRSIRPIDRSIHRRLSAAMSFLPLIFLLHGSGIDAIMGTQHLETCMSAAVYTATVLTSARAAAGMTSRARRPLDGYSAG